MKLLTAHPLTEKAFASFGAVHSVPKEAGRRDYFDGALANLRPSAGASLSVILAAPTLARRVPVTQFERHAFSSQSFIPMAACRWLVMVAPHAPAGGPDMTQVRAFLPAPGEGITLHADTWHAPLTVLDTPSAFAIFMWRDGGPSDEEFFPINPFEVEVPSSC